ncbi:MAG TPA: ABC transporter permease subunit [Lachnospiraceae bacterium]
MKAQKNKTKKHLLRKYLPLYLMLLPGIIYLLVNNYGPMFGLILAFKKIDYRLGYFSSPWCGLDNFKYLFSSKDAFVMFRNTLAYNLVFIILGNLLGIVVAISLDAIANKFFKRFSQVIILIPYLLSMVIVSYIVYAFLSGGNGFLNMTVLPALGMEPISWYNEAKHWPIILTIVYLWISFGYSSILYYSTLIGVDKSFYEAAVVDGASVWAQIKYITLPALKPTIITLMLLAVGRICYSDFGLFYQIPQNSGLLYETTQTIDTYVFRGLMELNDIGRSTAGGFLQSMLGFILVLIANKVVSKIDKDSSLF